MSDDMKEHDPQKFSLKLYEYVWIKIDIHTTLSKEFSAQSLAGAQGTYPIGPQKAQEKAWTLVDDFLEEGGFTINVSSEKEKQGMELPCPVFRPRHHLVLVDQIFREYGVSVIVFPVHTDSEIGSPRDDEAIFDRLIRPTLVPIVYPNDIESAPNDAVCLRTNRKLPVEEPISQNVYSSGMFTVGSLVGDASRSVCLNLASIDTFAEVVRCTYESINEEYPKALVLNGGVETIGGLECGCLRGAHPSPSTNCEVPLTIPSDIVVEATYEAPVGVGSSLTGLSLLEETERTLQIVELFAQWLAISPVPGFE